jgi:uncharacterized protein YraI
MFETVHGRKMGAALTTLRLLPDSMSRLVASLLVTASLLAMAPSAQAQLDTTRRAVVVRAGPDNIFPQVARLPNASNVRVIGCVADRPWCDVLSGRTRGFIPVNDLSQSSRLRSAPTVTFSVAEYWDAHYRTRAWHASRDNWTGWGTPGWQPPAARPR